jgi:O-antigen ligase
MAIGALPFVWGSFPKYQIVILGVPGWPGYVQGFDVTLLDLLIAMVFFSLPRTRNKIPFKYVFVLYISAVLLSAFQAGNPMATFYYVWQLIRIFIVYLIIARACSDTRLLVALLQGLAIGVCFETAIVFWQRFVIHYVQAPGNFVQQNMLGFAMHFVIFPFFALLLAGGKEWQPRSVPFLGILIDVFTASRAALGFAILGFSFLFGISLLKQWTPRKTRVLLTAILALSLVAPLAYRQFSYRFHTFGTPVNEGGRQSMNDAAEMILLDHPMGIGANNFVVVSNIKGYAERAGVNEENRHTFPHNIYWTTAAESGYIGLIALLFFLVRPFSLALAWGWRHRKDLRGDLLLGLATTLLIVDIHSYYEWIFFTDRIQYILAIDLGLIAGLLAQLGYRPLSGRRQAANNRSV